jgi:hypothetical protein
MLSNFLKSQFPFPTSTVTLWSPSFHYVKCTTELTQCERQCTCPRNKYSPAHTLLSRHTSSWFLSKWAKLDAALNKIARKKKTLVPRRYFTSEIHKISTKIIFLWLHDIPNSLKSMLLKCFYSFTTWQDMSFDSDRNTKLKVAKLQMKDKPQINTLQNNHVVKIILGTRIRITCKEHYHTLLRLIFCEDGDSMLLWKVCIYFKSSSAPLLETRNSPSTTTPASQLNNHGCRTYWQQYYVNLYF